MLVVPLCIAEQELKFAMYFYVENMTEGNIDHISIKVVNIF